MSKIKQIIKLYSRGMGKKKIGHRLGISKNTVKYYVEELYKVTTPWDELLKLTDHELNQKLHPPQQTPVNSRIRQLYEFFPKMERNLRKKGMTVNMQFKEFKQIHPDAYAETAFYKYYNQWKKKVYPVMHIEHKIGDKMYVDYAGATLPYVDTDTGEIKKSQVFVAVLGWSQYTYVEAMRSQSIEDFIAACENAIRYFKGVPLAIVPDNLKSAVFKPNKYEPEPNENFKAFADHYGIAILPARVRKPQDKAHVENMVKISYNRIYTQIPQDQTLPLSELNTHIRKHLTELNDTTLTAKEYSRTDQWLLEIPTLQAIPEKYYEIRTIKQVTVMKNGHVELREDQHYYSVPYELIGKKLNMQYSRSLVELYNEYELVATHKRIRSRHNYSTTPEHMPPQHKYLTEWSPEFFTEKGKLIDPAVEYYLQQVLNKKAHPQQGYRSCQGILMLAKKVGNQRLIGACKRATDLGNFNYKTIEDILRRGLDNYNDEPIPLHMPAHDNIRGGNYYN